MRTGAVLSWSLPLLALIHRSAWNKNSRKFTVAKWYPGTVLVSVRAGTFAERSAITRTFALFVARYCDKRFRLATVGLPENYGKSARCAHYYSQNTLPTTVTTLAPPLPPP